LIQHADERQGADARVATALAARDLTLSPWRPALLLEP
jgi:hypothetical protein